MKSDQALMQRFALVHDGSAQGWQTAYLAIHVAARLGALLQVWLADTNADIESLAQRAAQLEIGGRSAGVSLTTQVVQGISLKTLAERDLASINGVFFPYHLLPEDDSVINLLDKMSCPVWIVADEPKTHTMAILVDDYVGDQQFILYATLMSQRMNESITGLLVGAPPLQMLHGVAEITWFPLKDSALPTIVSALQQLHIDLLFLSHANVSLVRSLERTCVVYPAVMDA
jgi:hypothetical protein